MSDPPEPDDTLLLEDAIEPMVTSTPISSPPPVAPLVEETQLITVRQPIATPATPPSRPWLDIGFQPAAAGADDVQASVQFSLAVSNVGGAPARRVRMEARMFAMGEGHDEALAAFFAAPPVSPTSIASAIPPGVSTELRTQVTLPRADVRPIMHADRILFVPVVAINLLYEGDDGLQGQTAMSYVVGRESSPPAAKMAPFRLDRGPRTYREVGGRQHDLRRVA